MSYKYSFAQRANWPLSVNPFMKLLDDLKKSQVPVLDLTESNPTRCGFSYPTETMLKLLSHPASLKYDPSPRGSFKAREAISAYYLKKGLKVLPEQIFLTSSTSEGYAFLFRLLANVDDRVLFPQPSYPLFQYFVDLNDINISYYPLTYQNNSWQIDFKNIDEKVWHGAKAVVLVNPNNPTGSFVSSSEQDQLNILLRKNNAAIISDEVFADFILDESVSAVSLVENKNVLTFVLSGLSKTLALPQMKLSWIVVNGPMQLVQEASDRLEVIADTFLSVNTPVQNALPYWLEEKDLIQDEVKKRLRENLTYIKKRVVAFPKIELYHVQAGWYVILKFPSKISEDQFVFSLLKDKNVFVHPGYFFDFEEDGHIVISLLPKKEIFQEGIEQIFSFF